MWDLVGSDLEAVHYQITDPQGNELGNGRADVNALGGFDFAYHPAANGQPGLCPDHFQTEGEFVRLGRPDLRHGFQIQEFRRPEFEVTARNETTGPYFAGERAVLAVEAKYYAGGALPNADVTWQVSSIPQPLLTAQLARFYLWHWKPWWFGSDL